ncbi:hypothetical protein [Paraburkholderia sp. SIMBA_030]|uniref:hypothetical protein n=1 Tax=Paraburkholderia sp. SIMBA_030 TaxID=3085773 RepID=UPI003979FC5A
MLVTYVLGNCPGCGQENSFGNVEVYGDHVLQGCKRCRYSHGLMLPPIRKKVIYLDQFFFSCAFRGRDARFVQAAERIKQLAEDQLLVAPYSSIHEDETQWRDYADQLYPFIKDTSRGAEFERASEVEKTQLTRAFRAWLAGEPADHVISLEDALEEEHVAEWDGYIRIEVGGYLGDAELLAQLKRQSVEQLVDLFPEWRTSQRSFEGDVEAEYAQIGPTLIGSYLEFVFRMFRGDIDVFLDSPAIAMIVQEFMFLLPEEMPAEDKLRRCGEFFRSDHFKNVPTQWLTTHMLATLKAIVKAGSYQNREKALGRLSGVFFDIKHISTYAPYVDAFIMDQPMAELVSHPGVRLTERYGTRVFSLNNWDELFVWFDELEAAMSAEHRQGVLDAYPYRRAQQ